MKKLKISLIGVLLIVNLVSSKAQLCNNLLLTQEGTVLEYTHYDKKDKPSGKSIQEITQVKNENNATIAEIHSTMYDKKDNLTFESDMTFRCSNEGLFISMENYLAGESMSGFREMDMEIQGDDLLIPKNISVGDVIPGGTMKLIMSGSTTPVMNFTIKVGDRKVEAKEDITTPAGTFTCYKISYETETQMIMNIKTTSVEWFSMEVGQVKTESYARNGKLMGTMVLTNLKK